MRSLLIIGLFFSISPAFAQVDTSYFYTDAMLKKVKPERAKFIFKSYKKDSASWMFLKYDEKKVLLLKETYADADLKIKNGLAIEYRYGKPVLKGMYINNQKEGNFISYDTSGTTTHIKAYKQDSLNGPSYTFYKSGAKMREDIYGDKSKIQSILFYENGNIALKENFTDNGIRIDSTYLDINGNPVKRAMIESPPRYPGGIEKFYQSLARNVRYPKEAMEANAKGTVHLSFIILEDGNITDVRIEKSLYPSLDQEAMRALRMSEKWIPGLFFGKPVKVKYNVPIKFDLMGGGYRN
jgi:TonB family protein